MPWQVDIEKLFNNEYWTNRYIISTTDLATSVTVGQQIADIERAVLYTTMMQTKFRVSDGVKNTDVYQVVPLNRAGTYAMAGSLLPLFCVARVDFATAGGGRPSRKYIRGFLGEGNTADGTIESPGITTLNTYGTNLRAIPEFVDVDGQVFISHAVWPMIAMRQLRRGSRRRTEPVL